VIGPNLKKYVEDRNMLDRVFNKGKKSDEWNLDALTPATLKEIKTSLEADLSPENLCCDGELQGAGLRRKTKYLYGVKAELESLGVKVEG